MTTRNLQGRLRVLIAFLSTSDYDKFPAERFKTKRWWLTLWADTQRLGQ